MAFWQRLGHAVDHIIAGRCHGTPTGLLQHAAIITGRLDAGWQSYAQQRRVHIGDLTARGSSAGGKSSKGAAGKRSLFLLYMDAVSIVNQRAASDSSKNSDQLSQPIDHLPAHQATSFTLRDLHFIIKFAKVIHIAALCMVVLCSAEGLHRDGWTQLLCAVQHHRTSSSRTS